MSRSRRRLLVVSHPAVLAVNQLPYVELRRLGWDPFIVVPSAWRHEYAAGTFPPEVSEQLRGRVVGRRVVLSGRVQRHFYLTRTEKLVAEVRPDVAFLEAEVTSAAAFQWSRSLVRAGIPYGVQIAENLERPWPLPARAFRRYTLGHAAFVAARSPTAASLADRIRPGVAAPVVPHHVPQWPAASAASSEQFVVGYAGRLVPEKGLNVLIDAARGVDNLLVRMVGNGPLREELQQQATANAVALEIDSDVKHEDMASAYGQFDVMVLPSRTTQTWVEQFGRVLVEAMWCGVPVVGSDSGEIPWVINTTGGGIVVPEGDAGALNAALVRLRDSPALRNELGKRGQENVKAQFSVEATARELDLALEAALSADHASGRRQ